MSSFPVCESQKLNILHTVPSIGRRSGGLGAVAIGLAREQCDLGHNAAVWCLDPPVEAAAVAKQNGLESHVFAYPTWGPPSVGYSPAMERAVCLPEGQIYDIVHQHGIWMANSRVTNIWRVALGRPTVVAPHGALEEFALRRSKWKKQLALLCYEARNLKSASCLHATAKSEAVSLRNHGLRNPIAVIPNGIPDAWLHDRGDPVRFRVRFSIPHDRRLLLYLSRIHPNKGLPLLLKAMAHMSRQLKDWLLVIAGPDEVGHRRELQILSKRLSIEHLVQFVGPLFGKEKQDALAASDILVLPTYSENFAIVVAEALGAGIPVLTTRGAPWEELRTYRCGWWVDIGIEAIGDALLDAVRRTKNELEAMGQRGKTLIAKRYTWSRVAHKTQVLYEWLLGRRSCPDFVMLE